LNDPLDYFRRDRVILATGFGLLRLPIDAASDEARTSSRDVLLGHANAVCELATRNAISAQQDDLCSARVTGARTGTPAAFQHTYALSASTESLACRG
jgi:hypothetical protein